MRNTGNPRRRWKMAVGAVLIVPVLAAVLFALYVVGARSFLSTNRLRALINTSPESTWIDYDEAASVWPGRLRVKNLRIRGRDRNVEWFIRLEEVRADFSLGDLLGRKFHVRKARGSGLSFRLRELRKAGDASPAPVALLPPIPGFADPPVAVPAPHTLAPANPRPWTVEIENLEVESFDEIWVGVFHSRGPARLTGGFFLRSGLEAAVGPAAIDFLAGDVKVGEETLLASRTGRVECRIQRHDPRQVVGDAIWGRISGAVTLEGTLEGTRFLDYFLRRSPEPRFSGGRGTVRVKARIQRGIAVGQVHLALERLEARTASAAMRGDAAVAFRFPSWDLQLSALDFSGSRLELSRVTSLSEGSRDWWGRFDLPTARRDRGLAARVEAKCRDARPLFSLLGTSLPKWTHGLLEMEGLAASADVALSGPAVAVRGLDAKGGSFHIEGEYRKTAGSKDGIFLIDAGKVNVGVQTGDRKGLHLIDARGWFDKARDERFGGRAARDQRAGSTTTAVP